MRFVANNRFVLGCLCMYTHEFGTGELNPTIYFNGQCSKRNVAVMIQQQLKFQSIKSIKKLGHGFDIFAFEIGPDNLFYQKKIIKNAHRFHDTFHTLFNSM